MADVLQEAEFIDHDDIVDDGDDFDYDEKKKKFSQFYLMKTQLRRNKQMIWIVGAIVVIYLLFTLIFHKHYHYYRQPDDIIYGKPAVISYAGLQRKFEGLLYKSEQIDWSQYAYILYATNLNYLCAAMMAFHKLKKDYGTKADLVLFYDTEDEEIHRPDYLEFAENYEDIAEELGVKLVRIKHNKNAWAEYDVTDKNFEDSFQKLEIFQFQKYEKHLSNYKRIIYFDADVHLNDKMDELFFINDEFDLAMPLAYWLIDSKKNNWNFLDKYSSEEPNFATDSDDLEYFRMKYTGFKWSTALMVIKPSYELNKAVNLQLSLRDKNDYDMDIINDIFDPKASTAVYHYNDLKVLTLPHKNYLSITGDIFLTPKNRHFYLANPIDLPFINDFSLKKCKKGWFSSSKTPYWCKTDKSDGFLDEYKQTKIVHFSDFPLSKPWVQSYLEVICSQTDLKDRELRNTIVVEDCDDYNVWGHYHNEFIRNRLSVCGLHQEEDVDHVY